MSYHPLYPVYGLRSILWRVSQEDIWKATRHRKDCWDCRFLHHCRNWAQPTLLALSHHSWTRSRQAPPLQEATFLTWREQATHLWLRITALEMLISTYRMNQTYLLLAAHNTPYSVSDILVLAQQTGIHRVYGFNVLCQTQRMAYCYSLRQEYQPLSEPLDVCWLQLVRYWADWDKWGSECLGLNYFFFLVFIMM